MDDLKAKQLIASVETMQQQAGSLMQSIDSALVAIRALEHRVKGVVDEQAADRRLWNPSPAPGGDVEYMQAALRRLHAAVEGEDVSWLDRRVMFNPSCEVCRQRVSGVPFNKPPT